MMEQVNVTLTETIKVLLDDKKFSTLRDILITMKPFDIAAVFENLQDAKNADSVSYSAKGACGGNLCRNG